MNKDKWIFYTDLFGGQRWEKVDTTGLTVADSQKGFSSLEEVLADARLHGYQPGEDCTGCALEWRRERVVSGAVRDRSEEDVVFVN